ncbi:MAG: hypothetical protein ACLVIY_01975 [Anaerobutyricum soehngenii]
MKFHRVLLFTSIQMDITPVGDDLHVLLTCGGENRLGCTAFSTPVPDTDPVECETSVITDVDNPEDLFCPYIAESLCKKTGQRVLCTGGIFVENHEHQIDKLYENVDEMIMGLGSHFLIISYLRSAAERKTREA